MGLSAISIGGWYPKSGKKTRLDIHEGILDI